jgi:translation initiation factor IF-3
VEYADAIIAVSEGMRHDVLDAYPTIDPDRVHVVHNGIDATVWHPGLPAEGSRMILDELGVRTDRPIVAFVGRITRQKGVGHLLAAAREFDPEIQLVLCAGAPDTPEIANEVSTAFLGLREQRTGVVWIEEMLPRQQVTALLAASTVFVCPSVYEPLGIVSLAEALRMAGEADVDLVEIAATANPPVCRLMDYGKFKYQEQKKAAEAKSKQKVIEVKEVKFRPGTDEGDYAIKMRNLRRFIEEDGDKGKVTLRYRGREITHQDIGMRLLERIRDELADVSVVEHMPKLEGRQMIMVLAPPRKQ